MLQLYAEYSPEYACLFPGLVAQQRVAGEAFGGRQPGLHITLEMVDDQGGYRPGDEPAYAGTARPPWGSRRPDGQGQSPSSRATSMSCTSVVPSPTSRIFESR